MIRWAAGGLFGVVLLPVVAAVALGGGSGGCGTAGGGTFVGAPGAAVITGRVSTFGPPGEPAGATASGNPGGDAAPGISLHIPGTHYSDPRNEALMGHVFHVQIGTFSADLTDIDVGPADYLNRAIDVTGAGATAMGIQPGAFPTDRIGTATELPAGTAPTTVPVSLPLGPAPACASSGVGVINDPRLGPTVDPVPGAVMSRLDMGFDGTETRAFLSPFNGRVTYSSPSDSGWQGGGYVAVQSVSDPSMCYYAAEGLTPVVQTGATVPAGQVIATPRPSPYNTIVGNFEVGRCFPANPRDTLAHNVPDPKAMVLRFYAWMRTLGVGPTTNASNAGYA
jgi:hypothetical protein